MSEHQQPTNRYVPIQTNLHVHVLCTWAEVKYRMNNLSETSTIQTLLETGYDLTA